MLFTYQMRPQFGQLAFPEMRKEIEQFLGRDESENRVSQKLELLVVSNRAALGRLKRFQFSCLGSMG